MLETTIFKIFALFNLIEILAGDYRSTFALSNSFLLETHIFEEICLLRSHFEEVQSETDSY